MERPRALQLPRPRTLIAILARPILERLILWYLHALCTQQDEINRLLAGQITALDRKWEEQFARQRDELNRAIAGQITPLDRKWEEQFAHQRDEINRAIADQISALDSKWAEQLASHGQWHAHVASLQASLAAQKSQSDIAHQTFAQQISCLTELVGECLIAHAHPHRQTTQDTQP